MLSTSAASRRRFREYKLELEKRRREGADPSKPTGPGDSPRPKRARTFWQLFKRFFAMLGNQRRQVFLALATLTVSSVLGLAPPAATKLAIDNVLSDRPLSPRIAELLGGDPGRGRLLMFLAAGVIAISLVETAIQIFGRWRATVATKRMQASVRREVFEHAVRLPLHRVYQLKSGGVASILREDAGGIADMIFSMLYNPWRAIVQFTGSVAILAWVDWRLLLASLFLVPMVFFTHRTWINRLRPLFRDVRNQRQEIDAHTTEAFGGMRVVRAFGRQRSEAGRFTKSNHFMSRQELLVWWWARGIEIVWAVMTPVATSALLMYGGSRVLSGALTMGDLVMFLFYLAMLLGPLAVLANSATQLQTNLAGLDRVLDLLDEPRELPPTGNIQTVRAPEVAGRVTLDHVDFRYPGAAELVINDLSLDVRPGETIALVGPSGAGKTTLSNLVARFYDPTSGSIALDGVDLREIDLESYRRLLGIVEQEIFLFDGTVAENIGYANRRAGRDEIQRAARIAHADEFIAELEKGYETLIGERGVRLSGGQRQRLAIARAVLADPRILILDEATSNLDTESERLIQTTLIDLMSGRTCFVIAHRLSTIRHADRIVVLDRGRIQEIGTHDELMSQSTRYRRMVRQQMGLEDALQIAEKPALTLTGPSPILPAATDAMDRATR